MKTKLLVLFILVICSALKAQGNVYLVLGSDTGMWDGLDPEDYNCYIKGDLYTDPARNAYKVMQESFRNSITDSYGNSLRLTWWMMSGNLFYFTKNANTPNPNSMALYLMKKYHGDKIAQFGDELTLHYHPYVWTNYNGVYYWNQPYKFIESLKDFNFTLAQNLLDENMFPVSFRSGWHFMDNDWQNYLNKLLPYSLHNDWPVKTLVDSSLWRGNVIDWSKAPSAWEPYHPSPDNYQIPGNSSGWNTRSKHIGAVTQKEMDTIFARANRGTDQLPCLWGHLPEEDFLQNLKRVDSLVHVSAGKFPSVKFRYCTAVEAFQRWLKKNDTTAPALQIEEIEENGKIAYNITTDEEIFQAQPFFAVKDIYEKYTILNCQKSGTNTWKTEFFSKKILAKAGAAVTDIAGNLTKKLINYLPDDIFADNESASLITLNSGNWNRVVDHSCFDISYLKSTVDTSAETAISVKGLLPQSGKYNIFVQFAMTDKPADSILAVIDQAGKNLATKVLKGPLNQRSWIYLATINSADIVPVDIKLSTGGKLQAGKTLAFDALKISPLVKDKELFMRSDMTDVGDVIVEKATDINLSFENRGTDPIQILKISVDGSNAYVSADLPLTFEGMKPISLPIKVKPTKPGPFADTLYITSNDPVHPVLKMTLKGTGVNYYLLMDNEEPFCYKETGKWAYSNSSGFGGSSRYALLNQKPGARATYTKMIEKEGTYDFLHFIPGNVNSTNHALYVISAGSATKDSFYVDQNAGSGTWIKLSTLCLQKGDDVKVDIIDAGGTTNPGGQVIRADAIRFNLHSITGTASDGIKYIPQEFALMQNYPNPFNPMTTIQYSLPKISDVSLKVYDILGSEIATLFNGRQSAGTYYLKFDMQRQAGQVSSGVYFYMLRAVPANGGHAYISTMKMLYLK
ncbi:MAG: T9SS type A sorting domain-containing protein [Ignavibacteriales bacterium]